MPKGSEIVKKGYDTIAKAYANQRHLYPNQELLQAFSKLLKKPAKVLDLGWGAGGPVCKFLVDSGYAVLGTDCSKEMLKLARKNVPKAKFKEMDMTKLDFKDDSFDGAVSFYALIHVPKEKHEKIYKALHKIVKSGGIILVTSGTSNWEETIEDYLGTKMFWSFYGPKKTSKTIEDAGFEIIWGKILKLGGEQQFWIMAKNKK